MEDLLNKVREVESNYTGRRLVYMLIGIFVFFVVVGFGVRVLWDSLNSTNNATNTSINQAENEIYYTGKVAYVNPQLYPNDDISYVLVDSSNKTIILLKGTSSADAKLNVAEGLWGRLYGTVTKTADGKKDVLIVDRIILNSTSKEN